MCFISNNKRTYQRKKRQAGNNQTQNTSRTNVFVRTDALSLVVVMSLSAVCMCGRTYMTLPLFSPVPLFFFCIDESQSFHFIYAVVAAAVLSRKNMLLYELFHEFIFDVF
jgi:hypothetical protein